MIVVWSSMKAISRFRRRSNSYATSAVPPSSLRLERLPTRAPWLRPLAPAVSTVLHPIYSGRCRTRAISDIRVAARTDQSLRTRYVGSEVGGTVNQGCRLSSFK